MKKLYTLLLIPTIFIALAACQESSSSDGWSDVYPGVDIYNRVVTTNRIATDGAGVALRLATLLEEAEAQGITLSEGSDIDWSAMNEFTLPFNELDYNLKELLFGENSKTVISKNGERYRVSYGVDSTFTAGYALDRFYRFGSYEIDTKGVKLSQSSDDTAWSITLATDLGMFFAENESSLASTRTILLNSQIWHSGSGVFKYESTACQATYLVDDAPTSEWNTYGSFRYSDYTDLTLEGILNSKFYHTVDSSSQGVTLTGRDIRYSTGGIKDSIIPFTYQPFETLLLIENGVEEAELNSEYCTEDYPSPYVKVEWIDDTPTIHYNGTVFNY